MGSRGFISDSVDYHLGEVKREESRAKITRKLLNLSQGEVCQGVGITRHLLSDVENGRTRSLHYDQALKLFRFYRDYFREHGSNSRGRFNALSVIRDGEDYVSFDFLCLQDLFAPIEKIARTSAQKESVPYKVVWIKDSADGRVVLVAERDFPLFKRRFLPSSDGLILRFLIFPPIIPMGLCPCTIPCFGIRCRHRRGLCGKMALRGGKTPPVAGGDYGRLLLQIPLILVHPFLLSRSAFLLLWRRRWFVFQERRRLAL